MSELTADMLWAIMPNAPENDPEDELPYIIETAKRYQITTKNRFACWIANVAKESGELMYLEELASGWDYEGREDLGNIYEGDGPLFKGHGYLQITGRNNHRVVGEALGIDAIDDPGILAQLPYAWYSAGYYWRYMSAWGDLNAFADEGDFAHTVLGVRGGEDPDRWHYYYTAMEVLPDDLDISAQGKEASVAITKDRLVSVDNEGWVYDLEEPVWIKVRDLPNRVFRTNANGYPSLVKAPVADEVPDSLEGRIKAVTAYGWELVEAGIPYWIWREGDYINVDGPPGYAVDLPAPAPSDILAIFCAGVGNVMRRKLGLPVPKNWGNRGYDGGTGAWGQWFWDDSIWFDLDQAEEGDVAFRSFARDGQGHWAYCTGGADEPVIQSYPDSWPDWTNLVEPGMNGDSTLRASHDGGYYEVLIKSKSWLL